MDCPRCGWDCEDIFGKWECTTCGWRSAAPIVYVPSPEHCREERDLHTKFADALTALPLDVLPEDMQAEVKHWCQDLQVKAEYWDDLLRDRKPK